MSRSWNSRYRVAGRIKHGTGYFSESLKEVKAKEERELKAMASVNLVILVGNLGKDPDLQYTQSGKAFAKFSMATTDTWTDQNGVKQEKTEWHRITVWGKQAENCNKYLKKGSSCYVEGKISTSKYQDEKGQDRYSTGVNAETVKFLPGGASRHDDGPPAGAERYDMAPDPMAPDHQG
jgi:single-strand DNA-binding protein